MPKQSSPLMIKELSGLIRQVREIIFSARSVIAQSVDTVQIAMDFDIGQRIVEHGGDKRVAYKEKLHDTL